MKYPAVYLNEFLGVPLDRITVTKDFCIVNWDIDVTECEKKGFMVDEFEEEKCIIKITGSICQVVFVKLFLMLMIS